VRRVQVDSAPVFGEMEERFLATEKLVDRACIVCVLGDKSRTQYICERCQRNALHRLVMLAQVKRIRPAKAGDERRVKNHAQE